MSAAHVSYTGNLEICFDELTHTYTRNGHKAPLSVTKLISNHFPEFKPEATVDEYFDIWRDKSNSKYYTLIHSHADEADAKKAILDLWEKNRQEACRLGTATHKAVELLLGGALLETCSNPEVEHEINAFLAWHAKKREQGWTLEATELVVGSMDAEDKLCLGGSVDAVFLNEEGKHVLVDWKRTKERFGPDERAPFAEFGSGPASELKDTKFNKYALQTAVYAQMLKRHLDIDVGDRRYLVRLSKEDGAQEISASGEAFDRVAEGLLRVAAGNEEEDEKENNPPPKRQKTETAQEEESNDDDNELEDPDDFFASVWDNYSGGMHDDDAPEGAYQTCYWTDGTLIERTKVNGVWKYNTTSE